jgi:hypothetical protein
MSEAAISGDEEVATPGVARRDTRDRVPMWLAVAITVVVSLPFGLWLGDLALPLWVAFIVWAEYFVLGARPEVLRIIIPSFIVGVLGAFAITTANAVLERVLADRWLVAEGDVAAFLAFFVGFCIFLYAIRWVPLPLETTGTLPFFNGVSMMLGVYFTDAFLAAAPSGMDPVLEPAVAAIGAVLAGMLGAFLGWFNATILFRETVPNGLARGDGDTTGQLAS